MPIHRGSRYEYATVDFVTFTLNGPTTPILIYYFDAIGTISYSEYVWKAGDRLDILAYEMYNSSSAWWQIAEHNPEIKDFSSIKPGTVIRIPSG